MSGTARRGLLGALVRRRLALFLATALLAVAVPFVASAPVRAIPLVASLAADAERTAPLGGLLPGLGGTTVGLGALLGILVGAGLLAAALSLAQSVLVARLNAVLAADVRVRLAEHLLRQPPSWHQRRGPGPLLGALTGDADMIALFLGNLLPAGFGVASGAIIWSITLGGGLAGSGVPGGSAAAVVAGVLVVLGAANAIAVRLTGRRAGKSQVLVQEARDEALGALTEALEGVEDIQASAAERDEGERLARRLELLARRQQTVAVWGALGNSLTQVVVIAAVPGLVVAATLLDAPAAALAVVLPSLTFLQVALASAAAVWTQSRLTRPALDRAAELLAEQPAIRDAADARPLGEVAGRIRFEAVRFTHARAERPLLDGVDFEVPAGATVALVGDGGSGKSTLLRLLLRFHEPSSGRVTLDGRDVRDVPLRDLRRRVALLGQHARLFARSVRDNVRLGVPEASEAEVATACRTAAAEPVLAKLPGGLDARVDPGAANLSGSERRRLALARVLARRPSVILLDEPEAGLPQALAERLMNDLREAARGRTCLVVTHRPDLLGTDSVVFLAGGRVAATGTHEELERSCEAYRSLLAQKRAVADRGGEER